MDFMKVLDQTVREIKREVNLKVLKVPEVEQKVLDATDNEPWGPHGTALAEIARATKKFTECQMVMNVLWTRLSETGKDWRHVYKALAVIEYLVAHGSERAIDDIVEHTFQISSLASFEFVEPNGKDMGINVRKKVENIVALLNDKDKIQEVRNKAEANRDKYFGLSSSGITYKSASASHGSSSYGSNQYSGFSGSRESYTLRDDYEERNRFNGGKFDKGTTKSHLGVAGENQWHTSKKAHTRHDSKDEDVSSSSMPSKKGNDFNKRGAVLSDGSSVPSSKYEDDFDPRGTSTADPVAGRSNQVDLFADNLVSGLIDAPVSLPTEGTNNSIEDDLFADATFVSRPADVGARANSLSPPHVNLFASQPPAPSPSSPIVDLFHTPDPVAQTETKTSKLEHINTNTVDPFASVPLNSYGSGLFGAFTSNTEVCIDPTKDDSLNSSGEKTSVESKSVPKKNDFKVKSGIWADSLSRGLIDLNISAPAKKVNLADMGIIGGDQRQKGGPLSSSSIGRTTSVGSGLGKTAAGGGGDIFSSLGGEQYQFGSFKK